MANEYNGQPSPGAGIDINRNPGATPPAVTPILPPNVVDPSELIRRRAIAEALRRSGGR